MDDEHRIRYFLAIAAIVAVAAMAASLITRLLV
jgi:hypothetical protein